MSQTIVVALAVSLVVSAAGVLTAVHLTESRMDPNAVPEASPPPAPTSPAEAAPQPAPSLLGAASRPALDPARQEAVEQRVAALEQQMREVVERVTALADEGDDADFEALSDEDLGVRAGSLFAYKNYAGALEAYEALVARNPDLDADKKGQLYMRLGQCYRATGELKKADLAYQQVEAIHGADSAGGLTARYQRAWIRHGQNDIEGAREFMLQVAQSPRSPVFWKLFSRANAADFSIRLGDTANARADLERFRAELEEDESSTGRQVLGYVLRLLKELDG